MAVRLATEGWQDVVTEAKHRADPDRPSGRPYRKWAEDVGLHWRTLQNWAWLGVLPDRDSLPVFLGYLRSRSWDDLIDRTLVSLGISDMRAYLYGSALSSPHLGDALAAVG